MINIKQCLFRAPNDATVSHNPSDYENDEMKAEVEATEKVINALAYYKKHVMHRLKLQAEAVL